MKAVLALDQGTTGSTALVIGDDGAVLGRGYRELPQHFPAPGMVEHDPEDIVRITLEAARDALAQARVVPQAVGITNQRETVCVWERATGRPLHRAIVWQDRRTAPLCAELARQGRGDAIRARTGLVLDPYFSATKIAWLLEHVSGLRARVAAGEAVFGTVDAWLLFRLTDGAAFATDHTNASRTMLYDIAARDWSEELLGVFGVPRAALPEVRRSSGPFGVTTSRHLGAEIQITGIAGDQQAALFGQGCWRPGEAKNTVGLGAPHWEAEARGTIVGLTRGTTRAHLVRAALEAMAFSTQEVIAAMTADAHLDLAALQVDGGASANDWLMQFQADLLGVPVARPDLVETTALGAAGLAGIASGVWRRAEDFLARRTFRRFTPDPAAVETRRRLGEWRRAVGAALHWAKAGKAPGS